METDPARGPEEIRLPFEPGDRFIQVHENGAILVVADDYEWNLATLGQAVAVALEAVERGTRVLLGHEVLDDRTVAVLEAVRSTGAEIVEFGTVIPPMQWPNGTTPLMTAASLGRTDLVEDLISRGVPAGTRDVAGGTALHRAAHTGDDAACDLLLAAGADVTARDDAGRTAADHAARAGHPELSRRLDPNPRSAVPPPPGAAEGDVAFPWGARVGFLYEVVGVVTVFAIFAAGAVQLDGWWAPLLLLVPLVVLWVVRHVLWAGGPLRLRDGALRLITLRGVVSVPLDEVRGIIVAPAHGLNGAPWRVVLCQDAVGRRATPARIRAAEEAYIDRDMAERFAGLAERYQVIVLGRGPSTEVVLAALRPSLDRPDVVGNRWWHELERYGALDIMTSRLHLR